MNIDKFKVPAINWKMELCKKSNTYWTSENAPNFIHRFMQKLILGIIWSRIE